MSTSLEGESIDQLEDKKDPLFERVFLMGQKYKDSVAILILRNQTIEESLQVSVKTLLSKINSPLNENNSKYLNKMKKKFPKLKEKNGCFYFFYNQLNSFVSFKENLFRLDFLSNKFKVSSIYSLEYQL